MAHDTTISFYRGGDERKYYKLTVHLAHRAAMDDCLKHVLDERKAIELQEWEKEFYDRIGKAWKRRYLLCGPPRTGKSTMIAAMANYLDYVVYDLELTAVKVNTQLWKLLIETTSKSMIVIEDIYCSENLTRKRKPEKEDNKEGYEQPPPPPEQPANKDQDDEKGSKVTLSGLLNFIDGLWSTSRGGERLIVFTTNHIEKLDSALIRTWRMDVRVEMGYCCFEAFKVLAKNYLLLEDHLLFGKVREMLEVEGVKMTPADVAENLMPKTSSARAAGHDTARICLRRLVEALEKAKNRTEEGGEKLPVPSINYRWTKFALLLLHPKLSISFSYIRRLKNYVSFL